jgi:hypothetical protein
MKSKHFFDSKVLIPPRLALTRVLLRVEDFAALQDFMKTLLTDVCAKIVKS